MCVCVCVCVCVHVRVGAIHSMFSKYASSIYARSGVIVWAEHTVCGCFFFVRLCVCVCVLVRI